MNFGPWIRALAASAVAALGVAACGGGGGGIGGTGGAMGTMRVSMTDAPACGYDHVWVTVQSVRVTTQDQDAGWEEILVDPQTGGRRIDLLELRNGDTTLLGEKQLPAGTYRQIRLVLAENNASNPLANAVQPSGMAIVPLETPSAQQSGLKVQINAAVPESQVAHVLLDFDACSSVHPAGGSGKFILRPVLSASLLLENAGLRVEGALALPAGELTATIVSVQASGPSGPIVAKSTSPRADGSFTLKPVPAGTYNLVVTSPARATMVMTSVPVALNAPTIVSNTTIPIAPAGIGAATARTVPGTVRPPTATVRALQRFEFGPVVEVQRAAVDAESGVFSFSLPVVSAQRTPFVPDLSALGQFAWIVDATTPAAYTVEATAPDGITKDTRGPFSVLTPTLPALNFTFP